MEDLAAGVGEVRATDPLLADVIAADAAARAAAMELSELHDLRQRVEREAPERPLLRWWALAMLGERAFLDTDLGVIPLAAQVLHELPDDPFLATPLLYVRGRLHRIAAAVYLVAPLPAAIAEHRRLRDAAVADFRRCGFTAEAAVTRGLAAALHALATWEDVLEDLEIVRDARALLGDLEGSMWVPVLDHLLSAVALTAGDLDTADAALAGVERQRHRHPVFAAYADVGRAEHALLCTGGSAATVDGLVAAVDRLRQTQPQLLPLAQQHAAYLLADAGHVGPARTLGLAGLGWPPPSPVMAVVGELLRTRIEILTTGHHPGDGATVSTTPRGRPTGGSPDEARAHSEARGATADATLDRARALLGQLEQMGLSRRAGALALRLARDLDRVAAGDPAAGLRAWGLARMPPAPRQTLWERRWAEPLATGERPSRGSIKVRVMRPVLEVEVAERPVRLRDMPAKLLLALLLAHPDPLHVEQAVDVLWPDVPVGTGRSRLNTVVHRLRNALGTGTGTLRRIGDVLLLVPDGWDVDLFHYRQALRERSDQQLDALRRKVSGNLCHVQFPYDDYFVEHRRALDVAGVSDVPDGSC